MKTILNAFCLIALFLAAFVAYAQFPFPAQPSVTLSAGTKPAAFYCIGADVSEIPGNEAHGTRYADVNGVQDDPLKIMARHGFNTIRLRLFVNPEAPGGYSREGFCGTASTIALAKRIKAAGMRFANAIVLAVPQNPSREYPPGASGFTKRRSRIVLKP